MRLRVDAKVPEISGQTLYDAFGALVSVVDLRTGEDWSVEVQVVEYDWLDMADDQRVARRLIREVRISLADALSVVERARTIRDECDQVAWLVDDVVTAYAEGDLAGVLSALEILESYEGVKGESVTASELERLFIQDEDEE